MGFLVRKQKGLIFSDIFNLATVLLISSLGFSFIDTLWSVYIETFVRSEAIVGLISSVLSLVSLISFFLIVPFIEKLDKSKTYSFSIISITICYIVLSVTKNFYLFLLLAVLATIFHTLRVTSFGIIIKDKSKKKNLSRNEGLMYTFMNLSWILGPLIVGGLSLTISTVFIMSSLLLILSLVYFLALKIKDKKTRNKVDKNIIKLFRDFFKDKNRRIAYFLGGGVNYWWSLVYIFMPLYIIKSGLKVSSVGYFLFFVAVPLILLTYLFSNIAGKIGFKKIFGIGFLIPAIASLICFFISDIYIIMGLMVLGSIGLSMLESTTEAYFFDCLKGKEDLRFYGPYNTTIDVNHFISRSLGGILLLFLPFKFIFLFFSFSMMIFFILSFKTKNIKEITRKN